MMMRRKYNKIPAIKRSEREKSDDDDDDPWPLQYNGGGGGGGEQNEVMQLFLYHLLYTHHLHY